MMKMGWNEGKGLGANEDGIVNNLKVNLKTNNFGIGANIKTSENWLSNSNDFEKLLEKLNASNSPPETDSLKKVVEVESASTASQIEKNTPKNPRFSHRSKFRRMKKMASSESHSLNEILGVRSSKNELPDVNTLETPEYKPITDQDGFVQTKTSSIDIREYFSQKNQDQNYINDVDFEKTQEDYSDHNFHGFKTYKIENDLDGCTNLSKTQEVVHENTSTEAPIKRPNQDTAFDNEDVKKSKKIKLVKENKKTEKIKSVKEKKSSKKEKSEKVKKISKKNRSKSEETVPNINQSEKEETDSNKDSKASISNVIEPKTPKTKDSEKPKTGSSKSDKDKSKKKKTGQLKSK
ncbi:PIN2/TERF1-interacting telomerase inhibitor 1 [Smittium mucronatum]|uniref:PIN2/TERF1-interacting telomerase inhibitor 1 n=1 Tax=Smittium mucronatum TaxID=133383 RepID=A0A1R0GSN5_9FUNG|nr:PIN2/TERF1-interacting telomerase inhibitor 1 [Smittium mucronatum]